MFIILPMVTLARSSCSSWLRFAGSVTTDGISLNHPVMFHPQRYRSLPLRCQARFHECLRRFTKTTMRILLLSILTCGALFSVRAADVQGAAKTNAPCPGCVKIFNGENFEGWEADPSTWSITNGAMRGVGGTSRLAFTKKDYGRFRLIFTARMNPVNRDHLGILFVAKARPRAGR